MNDGHSAGKSGKEDGFFRALSAHETARALRPLDDDPAIDGCRRRRAQQELQDLDRVIDPDVAGYHAQPDPAQRVQDDAERRRRPHPEYVGQSTRQRNRDHRNICRSIRPAQAATCSSEIRAERWGAMRLWI